MPPNRGRSRPKVLVVGLRTADEIEQIQRLRYDVFTEDMGAVFPDAQDGVEHDRFDPFCEHLMVRELDTGRVVGTYRILTPESPGGRRLLLRIRIRSRAWVRSATSWWKSAARARTPTIATAPSSCCCGPAWPSTCAVAATSTCWLRQRQPARRRRHRRRSVAHHLQAAAAGR